MAQDQIALLAEAADLNRATPYPDQDGWDFHFSVPRISPVDGSNFFDSDPPLVAMFAQVKGTITKERRRSIALSHWRHAATMTMPFFFVVVEFDVPPTPARLFVVHVDRALVERVAERLRKEGAKAKKSAPTLHKLTMDLVWDNSHEVPFDAAAMRSALLRHCGDDMRTYADAKRDWWELAGHSTLSNRLSLRIKGPRADVDRRLADWALGVTEKLCVDEFRRVEHRWGIAREFEPRTDVTFSFGSPPSIGRSPVRVSDRAGVEHAEFEADVFCNVCFIPYLPKETWALRLVCGFLDVIFRAESKAVTVRLSIPPNQPPVRLSELFTVARAVRLLSAPSTVTYRVPKYGNGGDYRSELNPGPGALGIDGDMNVMTMLEAAESAWRICAFFGAPSDISVRPVELEEKAEELREWTLALHSEDATLQIDVADQDGLQNGEPAAFLWFFSLNLGNYELMTAAVVEAPVEFVGERAQVSARPQFARRWVIDRRERTKWAARQFPRLAAELIEELESRGKICFVGDKKIAAAISAASLTDAP